MRRRLLALALAFGAALLATASALADNGGIAPPTPQSPNASDIRDLYWVLLGITGVIFVVVEVALLVFIVRFRGRGRARDVEGPQIRGHTRLELIWTGIPVLILAAIATFVFLKLPGINDVPDARAGAQRLQIDVVGHQFYWEFRYPNGEISIDELRAPVNDVVEVAITSPDVDHSWWIPELGGKFDALPGEVNHTWFRATREGTYKGQCGEFCGVFHALMTARVVITSREEYEQWLTTRRAELGRSEWEGACAKCHGMRGEGDYGPGISDNPLLEQRQGLERVVRSGVNTDLPGLMPPVGENWTDEQMNALFRYVSRNVYEGAANGG